MSGLRLTVPCVGWGRRASGKLRNPVPCLMTVPSFCRHPYSILPNHSGLSRHFAVGTPAVHHEPNESVQPPADAERQPPPSS